MSDVCVCAGDANAHEQSDLHDEQQQQQQQHAQSEFADEPQHFFHGDADGVSVHQALESPPSSPHIDVGADAADAILSATDTHDDALAAALVPDVAELASPSTASSLLAVSSVASPPPAVTLQSDSI